MTPCLTDGILYVPVKESLIPIKLDNVVMVNMTYSNCQSMSAYYIPMEYGESGKMATTGMGFMYWIDYHSLISQLGEHGFDIVIDPLDATTKSTWMFRKGARFQFVSNSRDHRMNVLYQNRCFGFNFVYLYTDLRALLRKKLWYNEILE